MNEAPIVSRALAPELTPEHAYLQALTAALLATLGPKKGQRLLAALRDHMAEAISRSEAIPIRADRDRHAREREAKLSAARCFQRDLPVLIRATCQ